MADKVYKIKIPLSDGTVKELFFVSPQGEDGISPSVAVGEKTSVVAGRYYTPVTITDKDKTQTFKVYDGITPSIEAVPIENGHQILIDVGGEGANFIVKNGDKGVSVAGAAINLDGDLIISLSDGNQINAGNTKGPQGDKGDAPELSIVSNPTVGDDGHGVAFYVDGRQVEYFEVMDGDDGFSPIVEIQQTASGHMVTITDKAHGEQSFEVLNGTGGGSGGGGSGLAHLVDGDKAGSIKSSGAANTSIGYSSFALGSGVSASGDFAFAQGFQTKASGKYSHAEGYGTEAIGTAAHAEGMSTVASYYSSHAEGTGTIAAGEDQHVQGTFNVEDADSKYLHIVGNGTSNTDRSNAHTIDRDGNAWFKGKVYIGGTGQDDPNAKELGTGGGSEMTDLETIALLAENDLLPTITDGGGRILTDAKNTIMLRY